MFGTCRGGCFSLLDAEVFWEDGTALTVCVKIHVKSQISFNLCLTVTGSTHHMGYFLWLAQDKSEYEVQLKLKCMFAEKINIDL